MPSADPGPEPTEPTEPTGPRPARFARRHRPAPLWRIPLALAVLFVATELWMLMMVRSRDTLVLEPTTDALARAASARGPVLGLAAGCALAVVLLAVVARRAVLLALAIPAALVLVLVPLRPEAASTILCAVATAVNGAFCAGSLLSRVLRSTRPGTAGAPVTVRLAAALAGTYAALLCVLAAVLVCEELTGTGHVGRLQLAGPSLRGLVTTVVALLVVASLLGTGASLLLRGRSARPVTVPLVVLFGVGTVGEAVDVIGGQTSTRSNGIGLGLLVLIILPVVLLAARTSREYLSTRSAVGRRP